MDAEPQGSATGAGAGVGAAQKSRACLVGTVATAGLGKGPHGSASSFWAPQETSATGALPAATGAAVDQKSAGLALLDVDGFRSMEEGVPTVDQKSPEWALLELDGFRSIEEGVPTNPHGSAASEPFEAGHEQGAADMLPHGWAAAAVSVDLGESECWRLRAGFLILEPCVCGILNPCDCDCASSPQGLLTSFDASGGTATFLGCWRLRAGGDDGCCESVLSHGSDSVAF